MLYGLTMAGEKDVRLVQFARAYAASGLRVAAPDLPGLKSFRYEPSDLALLEDLVLDLDAKYGGPIGLTAFSAGAGLALTLVTYPSLQDRIDPLLLFGPFYSFAELWARFLEQGSCAPASDREWDHHIFVWLVLAYRILDRLDLDAGDRSELVDLLARYCWEPSVEKKRRFYERVLKGHDLVGMQDQRPDGPVLSEISPCGRLAGVRCRVLVVHDRYDHVVPPDQSRRLYAELCLRDLPGRQQLLITGLLSHVSWHMGLELLNVPAVVRLLDLVGELFR
jgi:pimeloyl-ACP methyl ester carboxylesterase